MKPFDVSKFLGVFNVKADINQIGQENEHQENVIKQLEQDHEEVNQLMNMEAESKEIIEGFYILIFFFYKKNIFLFFISFNNTKDLQQAQKELEKEIEVVED